MKKLDRGSLRGVHPLARARSCLAAVGLAMSLAACAGTGAGGGLGEAATPGTISAAPEHGTTPPTSRAGDGSPSSTRQPGRVTTPPATRQPGATKPITPDQKLIRIRGRITEGVESGCVVLIAEGGSGTWLLLRAGNLRLPGGRVEVTGYVVYGLLTTCQQGRPLRVVSIRPL